MTPKPRCGPVSRRHFLALSLAATAATVPAAARSPSARLRDRFRRLFDRPRVPPDPQILSTRTQSGLLYQKITVATEAGVRTPVLVVLPVTSPSSTRRLPAVITLHGLGGSKEGMIPFLEDFARRGMVGVGIDARYHGDRHGDLTAGLIRSFETGKEYPYVFDTVWDTWRVMDYLQRRRDIRPNRIGVMGVSLGGHATWMVSADDRIRAAVPCISVCSWRWQIEHRGYGQRVRNVQGAFDVIARELGETTVTPRVVAATWERWMPGIPREFDCQEVLAAFAPRPLLIVGGDEDPVAPIEGARLAIDVIRAAYNRSEAVKRLHVSIAPHSGHTVTASQQTEIGDWMQRWLVD